MFELIALIIVVAAVIALIRPGKTQKLDTPIIVQREQYHITLAPPLYGAQAFIESIAKQIDLSADATHHNSSTLCFEVRDRTIAVAGHDFYLLAITQRGGKLYCQAITPQPLLRDRDSHFDMLMDFARAVMVNIQADDDAATDSSNTLISAANNAAHEHNIRIKQLAEQRAAS